MGYYSVGSAKLSATGETVYMAGGFKGKDSAAFKGKTSCDGGAENSVVVVAFDVSPSDAPVASWVTVIGCGSREGGTFVEGEYIYASGRLESGKASTLTPATGVAAATCKLTGAMGGFLVKLKKADGSCVWAKDMAATTRIVANADSVWTAIGSSSAFTFDADHVVNPADADFVVGKFRASDGVGLWGDLVGGGGYDRFYDMALTPQGPVAVGYSDSAAIGLGAVTANNLQQTDADKDRRKTAMFVIQISMTDTNPSCVTACPSGELTDATINPTSCFIEGKCLAHDAPVPRLPCFKCDATNHQKALPPLPDLTNHCYFTHDGDTLCRARGESAPAYARYGSNSVCETCDPDRDPNKWSLTTGFFHDRDFASSRSSGANDYGMYFASRASGCQILPDMPTPSAPMAGLTAANANPTVGTVAAIGARTTSAISAVNGAAKGNQGAETAWGWYHADSTKCAKEGDVCKHTPSAVSDALAVDFETVLHYGHSIARVKVQQALAILQSDLATPSTARSIADLKKDIVAHMLMPHYQGAIKAAYQMDAGTPSTAKADGAEHWKVIDAAVGSFAASDRAQLAAMFAPAASGKMNFCTVQTLLLRNLPGGSNLQYGSHDCILKGCKNITTQTPDEDDAQHVTAMDVGVLKVSLVNNEAKDCSVLAMPPPAPPPAKVKVVEEATVVFTLTASGSVSDYSDDTKSSLQQKYATAAGVDKSRVTIVIAAASVIITVTITLPAGTTAAAVESKISTTFGTSATAVSESLGLTVESAPTVTAKEAPKTAKESTDDSGGLTEGEIAGVAIGGAVGGIVLLGVVGLILRSILFKEAKPVFTCLEKSTAKSPA